MSAEPASPPEGGQGAAGEPPVSPPAAPPVAPATPPEPPPEPYYKSLKNSELRGYLEVKGFKGNSADELLENVVGSYRNLEKLRGVPPERLLTLPESMEDAEAMKPIYERLGLTPPATADEYGFVTMEGADPTFSKLAEETMHKIGVPAKYAKPLAEWWNTYAAEQQGATLREAEEEVALEMGKLKGEWAGKFDEKQEKARRVIRHLGFSEEELSAIEQVVGAGDLYRRFESAFDKIGMGESPVIEGEKQKGFGLTPEAAKVKLEELKTNKDWVARYMSGDKAAAAEMRRLQEIAHPGMVQS